MMDGYRQDKDETPDGFVDLDEWKEYFRCVGACKCVSVALSTVSRSVARMLNVLGFLLYYYL